MIPAKAEILLLRHGETEWNLEGRYQGALDSPLTERGREQGALTGKILAAHLGSPPPELTFVTSPQGRAVETAAIVARAAGLGAPLTDARLREVSLGSWDGQIGRGLNAPSADDAAGASLYERYFRRPDGESYEQAQARVGAWLAEARGLVVAMSHGLTGRILRGVYLGLSPDEALALTVPQDVIWRLAEGKVTPIR